MSEDTSNDDLDPTAFVKRIRELSERHEREDAERLSSIEADIEKGRSERAARRAERARSLSPDKTLSPRLPSPKPLDTASKPAMEALSPSISHSSAIDTTLDKMTGEPEPARPESPPKSVSALARSGTLSWQQRPKSGSIRRPLSVTSRASVISDKPTEEKAEPTRNQIAEALGSKDPSWFKQTADRGTGNPAFRRNQEEPEADSVRKFGLPGLSRVEPSPSNAESVGGATSPPPDSLRSSSPSRGSAAWSNRFSTATSNSTYSTTDPKPLSITTEAPKLSPSTTEPVAQVRPASPTRGGGGFVQSAMMKRSDSVNKRWSAQAGAGSLNRQNSAASMRSGISGSNSMPRLDQASPASRESSADASSRPSSSYSNHTITQDAPKLDDGFARPPLPQHARSKSTMSLSSVYDDNEETDRPASPSKRWSPTKSSWLESAINKPDSPRAASPTKAPSWMAELSKSKQQKANSSVPASPAVENTPLSLRSRPPEERFASPKPQPEPAAEAASKAKPETSEQGTSDMPAPLRSFTLEKEKTLPSEVKSKPETPPKKDFRSNLKPRDAPKEASHKPEPEFRNALGNLRRAETKNYVAPDTFTNNIKAGKAALAITGGVPQRVRRDELKESLVAQKEAIKAKKEADPDKPPSGVVSAPPKEEKLPEFLAARQRMGGKPPVAEKSKAATEAAQSPPGPLGRSATFAKPQSSGNAFGSSLGENGLAKANEAPQLEHKPSLSSTSPATPVHSRGPSKSTLTASSASTPSVLRAGVSSKLAERFNPGLANILARGPPAASPKPSASSSVEDLSGSPSLSRVQSAEPQESELLEHKTKGRARGPKRRAPATKAAKSAAPITTNQQQRPVPQQPSTHFRKVSLVKPELVLGSNAPVREAAEDDQTAEPTFPSEAPTSIAQRRVVSPSLEQIPDASSISGFEFGFGGSQVDSTSSTQSKPTAEPKAEVGDSPRRPYATLSKGGTASFADQIARRVGGAPQPSPSPSPAKPTFTPRSGSPATTTTVLPAVQTIAKVESRQDRSPSPVKAQSRPASPEKVEASSGPSVRNAATLWGRVDGSATSSPRTGPNSPIKLPNRKDGDEAQRGAGLDSAFESPAPTVGLGLGLGKNQNASATASKVEPLQRQAQYPMSPPPSAGLGLSSPKVRTQAPATVGSTTPVSPMKTATPKRARPPSIMLKPPESSTPQTSEASQLFSAFFNQKPVMPQSIDVDTQALISGYPVDTAKVRTTRKQIAEITNDGKIVSLPSNEEYTLFEGAMYVVAHAFERSNGNKAAEAYLWVGHMVSQSAAEDVQVFAKRFAKDNKATLEVVQQGKESSTFIQALGGIVITRRGARSQRNSTQQFMLCGRGHVGHITFDEIDFSLRSFSTGFPFLVFANGKLHLWKGAGSTVEEVSCARLIAMDIGVTPDVTEMTEGKEPASFIALFPPPEKGPKKIFPSADHWQRKANCERYRTRLFHVTTSAPTQQTQQGGLQVSSLWPSFMARRPSWSMSSQTPTTGARRPSSSTSSNRSSSPLPQTPTLLKATPPNVTTDTNTSVSVVEIAPYTQRDLEDREGVFVLDAFFEVYIILTPRSRSSPNAFTAALLLAQDYGILATSLEDRPLLPVSTVVIEGAPRDMKSCFRKWEDSRWTSGSAAVSLAAGNGADVKRGKSLRVVGLDAAIAAAMSR